MGAAASENPMPDKKRPNFLVFITDQQRFDHVGYAGLHPVRTPNIDGIARAGCVFENNFVASPTCMSNRASFMTGRMPSLHGVRYNGVPLDLGAVTFVDLLRAAGWRTALIGKSHLQSMSGEASFVPAPETRGAPPPAHLAEARPLAGELADYRAEVIPLWKQDPDRASAVPAPYYGFDDVRLVSGHGDTVSGHYERWLLDNFPDHAGLRGPEHRIDDRSVSAPQTYQTALPEAAYPTSWIARQTVDWLKARAGDDRPFFLQCSFPDPHHPFCPPGRYWDMYDPAGIALPPSFYESAYDQIPPVKLMWETFQRGDPAQRWTFPFVASEGDARQMLAKTFGLITMIDDAIGDVLRALDEAGLAEDTVVVFMSDHGDHMGEHGMFLKGAIHSPGVVRTPLVWNDPEAGPARRVGLSSTLDLAKTVLDRAGLAPANGMQGHSLMPMIRGEDHPVREAVLIEQTTQFKDYVGLTEITALSTLIAEGWRLTVWQGQEWGELYDLGNDPGELTNLWDDPAQAERKSRLLQKLVQEMQAHAETSPFPMTVS